MNVNKAIVIVFVVSLFLAGSSGRKSSRRSKVITRSIPFRVIEDDNVKAFNGLNTKFEPKRYAPINDANILKTTIYDTLQQKYWKTNSRSDKENSVKEKSKEGNKRNIKTQNNSYEQALWNDNSTQQNGASLNDGSTENNGTTWNDSSTEKNDTTWNDSSIQNNSTIWNDSLTQKNDTAWNESSTQENDSSLARIVGGTFSSPSSWPWQVSIQYLGEDLYWYHFCGGTLVDSKWIVSAAHCVIQLQYCTVRTVLGDYRLSDFADTEQVINPIRMLMHGYYNGTNNDYYYDIAMIELSKEVEINMFVQTVPLVTAKKDTFNYHDICYIAGWGNIIGSVYEIQMSDYLQQSRMTVLSLDECKVKYGEGIIETQICVQSHHSSACLGDSGSPLVCASGQVWMLVGIASWVGSDTCSPSFPSVYTRISSYEHWIRSVMGQAEY